MNFYFFSQVPTITYLDSHLPQEEARVKRYLGPSQAHNAINVLLLRNVSFLYAQSKVHSKFSPPKN